MSAELHFPDDLQRLAVDDVERAVGFVADVDAAAVGRDRGAVIHFDAVDHANHFIGGRIDEVHVVAGAVGLDDHHALAGGLQRQRGQHDGDCNHELLHLVAPVTKAFSTCHSGSFCELQCFPPLW